MTNEAKMNNRKKIFFSINGTGETAQLKAKESNWSTFLHQI